MARNLDGKESSGLTSSTGDFFSNGVTDHQRRAPPRQTARNAAQHPVTTRQSCSPPSQRPGPLGEILARAMIDNLNRFIIPNVAGPAKLVPLAALVDSDLSLVALRAAAQRGRLDAHQRSDGQWLSTCKAVNEYRTRRS